MGRLASQDANSDQLAKALSLLVTPSSLPAVLFLRPQSPQKLGCPPMLQIGTLRPRKVFLTCSQLLAVEPGLLLALLKGHHGQGVVEELGTSSRNICPAVQGSGREDCPEPALGSRCLILLHYRPVPPPRLCFRCSLGGGRGLTSP